MSQLVTRRTISLVAGCLVLGTAACGSPSSGGENTGSGGQAAGGRDGGTVEGGRDGGDAARNDAGSGDADGGGAPGSGGKAGSGGVGGPGGSGGGAPGSGGNTAGSGGSDGACQPATCGTHKWACWPMPTPASTNGAVHAHYTDLGDGTVRDDVTCLVWQKSVAPAQYNWVDGQAYCASLGDGWRLPTRVEMTSIIDHAKRPAIDATVFPGTPTSGYYYTSSGWIVSNVSGKPQYTWIFSFANGFTSNAGARTDLDNIRCVKGNGNGEAPTQAAVPPPNHYSAAAGEVTDNYTGLIWQQGMSPAKMAWTDTAAYCAALNLNGHAGWRVPALQELATLVDEAQVSPAIDRTAFPNTPWQNSGTVVSTNPVVVTENKDWFWASNPVGTSTTLGWGLNFMDGFTGPQNTTPLNSSGNVYWNYWTTAWVKCVR